MIKSLRIVFMGTPDFAVRSLEIINNSAHEIVGVVTAPDRKKGRGQKVIPSPVKIFAEEQDIKILQPEKLRDPEFEAKLRSMNADLFVVVAFRMLPQVIWSIPPKGTINLHASLLPQYRGAAPINWAIINGERITGTTTFFINEKIDTGEIILQNEVVIEEKETAGSLHDKLMDSGATLLLETIDQISTGKVEPKTQDHNGDLKPAPKIFKEDCKLNWNESAEKIVNKIRGLSPYPAAWTYFKNMRSDDNLVVKIYNADKVGTDENSKPGELITDGRTEILVGTSSNEAIKIEELQIQGKKRMKAKDLLNGLNINEFNIVIS